MQETEKGLQQPPATEVAAALAGKSLRELPTVSILGLLRFLCDEALDTERIRNVSSDHSSRV